MKLLSVLCTIGLFGIGASGCGESIHRSAGSSRTSTVDFTKSDRDKDNDGVNGRAGGRLDSDSNKSTLNFGRAANRTDKRAITALVKAYYAAAAAEDGGKACSMIYSTFAESVPEDYGTSPPGPAYARGTSCPAVMAKIFKHVHQQIVVKLPKLEVSRVRMRERQAIAILRFAKLPERQLQLKREGDTWKILGLLDSELP